MAEWLNQLLHFFSISSVGLPAIFAVSFVSATLLPMATEPVLFGFVKLNPNLFWAAILVATIGNTLGGMVTYYMGYGARELLAKEKPSVHLRWLQRLGAPVLLFSWLPLIGDGLAGTALETGIILDDNRQIFAICVDDRGLALGSRIILALDEGHIFIDFGLSRET